MIIPNKSEKFDQYNLRDCSRSPAQRNTLLVKFSLLWLCIFFGFILSVWTVVLKKTFESPLNGKEIKPANPKANKPWIFTERTDAETLKLWTPDVKSLLTGKDPDAGKDWRQEEKGVTEDEMVGWYHQLNGYGFEQAPGVGNGQGSLACYSPWGRKELDMTEQMNWTVWFSPFKGLPWWLRIRP